tara:strand:- start:186 stop:755 length:570 start_codon:yes stop_codon:yes gene_type:complete
MRIVDKPITEKTSGEIEKRIEGKGDFVQMSYLQRALNSHLGLETRKFVLLRLSGIYEDRKMFREASKSIRDASDINITFKDKIRDFMKSVELSIRGGDYREADRTFAKALALGNNQEKLEMKGNFKNYYLSHAKNLLNKDKRNHAKDVFEKVLTLDLDIGERRGIQKILLELYERLGMIREFYNLKKSL